MHCARHAGIWGGTRSAAAAALSTQHQTADCPVEAVGSQAQLPLQHRARRQKMSVLIDQKPNVTYPKRRPVPYEIITS